MNRVSPSVIATIMLAVLFMPLVSVTADTGKTYHVSQQYVPTQTQFTIWTDKAVYSIGETVAIHVSPFIRIGMSSWLLVYGPDGSQVRIDVVSETASIQAGPATGQYKVELWGQGVTFPTPPPELLANCYFQVGQTQPICSEGAVNVLEMCRDGQTWRHRQVCRNNAWHDEYQQCPIPQQAPTAYIDSISPNPAEQGQKVSFSGHGSDPDGYIVEYNWRSSMDGQLSNSQSFITSSLSLGTHTIYFKVKDNDSLWSGEATALLTVEMRTPVVVVTNMWDRLPSWWFFADQLLGPGSYATNIQVDVYVEPDVQDVNLTLKDVIVFAKWKPGDIPPVSLEPARLEPGHFVFKVATYAFLSKETAKSVFIFALFWTLSFIFPESVVIKILDKSYTLVGMAQTYLEDHGELTGIEVEYANGSKYSLSIENIDASLRTLPNVGDTIRNTAADWGRTLKGQWVMANCPVDILVTDGQGRRVGAVYKDDVFMEEVDEIPDSVYLGKESETKVIMIPRSSDFSVSIDVVGTEEGEYTLSTGIITQDSNYAVVSERITKGTVHEYSVSLSSDSQVVLQRASWWNLYWPYVLGGAIALGSAVASLALGRKRRPERPRVKEIRSTTGRPQVKSIQETGKRPRVLKVEEE